MFSDSSLGSLRSLRLPDDNLWAFVSRAVIRQFKVGHEIRNGPRAGQGIWFWNTKRGDAIKKFFFAQRF